MYVMEKFDFDIESPGPISELFLKNGVNTFTQALDFVRHLKYERNSDKDDLRTVLSELRGTCGSKHAVLKTLADENGHDEIQLILGIIKMDADFAKGISDILEQYGLQYIPEAHNYLKHDETRIDITFPDSNSDKLVGLILEEIPIEANQISNFKVTFHKAFLDDWTRSNPDINYTSEEIWKIREECIRALSQIIKK